MGSLLFLLALAAIQPLSQHCAAADDAISPILAPVINGFCDAVECGKGNCKVSLNHSFGFVCDCSPGWTQFHIHDHLRFLPCIIPNCSLRYSCDNEPAIAPAPSPEPPSNLSIFDPCMWSYCGGGSCMKTSFYEHRCDCKEGYTNLLNITSFPCFRDCSIGADCENLGITLSNATASSPPNTSAGGSGSSSGRAFHGPRSSSLWLLVLGTLMWLELHRDG